MEKNFMTEEKTEDLTLIILCWGKDGMLDVSDLDLKWSIWDDNDTEYNDDDAEILSVKMLRLNDDVIEIGWSQGKGCRFEPLDNWDFSEDHGGAHSNLTEYIYEEVTAAYHECSVVVFEYGSPRVDIIKIPQCIYDSFDDAEEWVLSNYPQYKHSQIMAMAYNGDVEVAERNYDEDID